MLRFSALFRHSKGQVALSTAAASNLNLGRSRHVNPIEPLPHAPIQRPSKPQFSSSPSHVKPTPVDRLAVAPNDEAMFSSSALVEEVDVAQQPKLTSPDALADSTPNEEPRSAAVPAAEMPFSHPVSLSGVFFSLDWNAAMLCSLFPFLPRSGAVDRMNPTAQLTFRERRKTDGTQRAVCRLRYECEFEASEGVKLEAIARLQVGWIAPRLENIQQQLRGSRRGDSGAAAEGPPATLLLGRGWDVSVPLLFHFTTIDILRPRQESEDPDEALDLNIGGATYRPTGSKLCFSGTPWLGISAGFTRIRSGRLVFRPSEFVSLKNELAASPRDSSSDHSWQDQRSEFFFWHRVHWRQMGFLAFKLLSYAGAIVLPLKTVWEALLPKALLETAKVAQHKD